MNTPNPYDIADDGCNCGAYSPGDCYCGRYVDRAWRRVWQEGYDAARRDTEACRHGQPEGSCAACAACAACDGSCGACPYGGVGSA